MADDGFIDLLRERSAYPFALVIVPQASFTSIVEISGGKLQIRPHKDFQPTKGRDRLLSLKFLLDLLPGSAISTETNSEPRNANDFIQNRTDNGGDPTTKRWNASIRMSNFASSDSSPLCVSINLKPGLSVDSDTAKMASIGALIDHLIRVHAVGALEDEGASEIEIHNIEALALYACSQRL